MNEKIYRGYGYGDDTELTTSMQTGKGYGEEQNFFNISYTYFDRNGISKKGNDVHFSINDIESLISDYFSNSNYTDANIFGLCFSPIDFNAKKGLFLPDDKAYQAYDKLIEIANQSGLEIDKTRSFKPRRDYKNCEKIEFKDVIDELGIEIGTAQEQRVRPYPTFYYESYDEETRTVSGDWVYGNPDKIHALHEDYELVQYGDFVFDKRNSTLPIKTDTYYDTLFDSDIDNNDNPDPVPAADEGNEDTETARERGIKFKVSDIRNDIRKGVAYNVVNQIQFGYIQQTQGKDDSKFNGKYSDACYVYTGNTGYNGYEYSGGYIRNSEWLGYRYVDDSGKKKMFTRGNFYYIGGEFITNSNTSETGLHEFVGYTFDYEGFANTTLNAQKIPYEYYMWGAKDGHGSVMRNTERTNKNDVTFDLDKLVKRSGVYNVSVTAKNPIGESEPSVLEDVIVNIADIEITMTADQPVYNSDETVEFTETVTNTGNVKLTNIIIYQTAVGDYVPMDGMTVKGTKALIAELDVGKSIDIIYRVPANNARNGILTNTAEITENTHDVADTASATVVVNVLNPLMTLTAVSDKKTYTDGDTVVITTTVENKGSKIFKDIEVNNSITGGKFTDIDQAVVTKTENDNSVIINTLNPGDKITLKYEIPAQNIETGKNGAVQSIVTANDGENTHGSAVEFRVIRPALTIKATPAKTEYNNEEDVTYTLLVKNTGNITLTDVTVNAAITGEFAESDQGTVNSKGEMVIPELPAGKSVSLSYKVKAANTSYGELENLFSVTCNEEASAKADTEVKIAYYGIDVMKTVDEKTYVVGDTVIFHTKITNTGDGELNNIYITEDSEGTFKLKDGAVIYTDDTIVIASIKPGESYTYDYYVTATEDKLRDGTVGGTSSVSIEDKTVGSDSASAQVYKQSMTFTKTVNSDKEYRRGDKVVWTDTVTNTGECELTNIVITESLIGEFKTDYETTADSVTIPKLAKGESATVEFTTTITPADVIDRTYTCTAEVTARESLIDTATASVQIAGPAVTVGKYADKSYYAKGERVVFTEVITNSGDTVLTNVKATENLDGKFMRYDKSYTADGKTLTIPEIAVGDSVVFQYAVDRSLIEGDTVTSTVTVTCDEGLTGTATAVVKIDNSPDTDTSKGDTAADTGKDTNTDTEADTSKDTNTDTEADTNKDTNKDTNTDTTTDTNTDTNKDDTDTSTVTNKDTDTAGKESEDKPEKKYLMGDVNMDGKVTGKDALLIQRYAINLEKLEPVQLFLADVTNDKKVSAADALNIIRHTIKLHTSSRTGEQVEIPKELL